jgi:quercetin dioxygenase-like cupin family protein
VKPALAAVLFVIAVTAGSLRGQEVATSQAAAIVANPGTVKWELDAKDKSESAVLREDNATGAFEMFVRYPAGHVFAPHWHAANERILLLEGRMVVEEGGDKKYLDPGGFAYLPARQVQRLSCVSSTRCTFYVHWDSKLDFHRASEDPAHAK